MLSRVELVPDGVQWVAVADLAVHDSGDAPVQLESPLESSLCDRIGFTLGPGELVSGRRRRHEQMDMSGRVADKGEDGLQEVAGVERLVGHDEIAMIHLDLPDNDYLVTVMTVCMPSL